MIYDFGTLRRAGLKILRVTSVTYGGSFDEFFVNETPDKGRMDEPRVVIARI